MSNEYLQKYILLKDKYSYLLDHTEAFEYVLELFDSCIQNSSLPVIEVGTNMAGSAMCFLELINDKFVKTQECNWLYTVDPYGSIPYHNGGFEIEKSVYDNERYRHSIKTLSDFAYDRKVNHYHFKATAREFVKHHQHNFVQYENGKGEFLSKYCFVFLDGSHGHDDVVYEANSFMDRIADNGIIIVDDVTKERMATYTNALSGRHDFHSFKVSDINSQRMVMKKC